ncbi:MAG: ATP-binding cassette domain-containing protein [Actinobacteria bacterium]|nr:ATP-binding cassette domain-containing protein [Actinomycetota bacterium]
MANGEGEEAEQDRLSRQRRLTQVEGFDQFTSSDQLVRTRRPAGVSGVFSTIHGATPRGLRVGRTDENDIVIDDLLVSRHHAELRETKDGDYELVDLGSTNGTYVNGRRVERAVLKELDVVAIGHHLFRLVGSRLEEYVDQGLITFQARDLCVTTSDGRTLLDQVSLSLEERDFLAVVGPSGAGKSTLLNALAGFRPARRGTVLYDGRDLYSDYGELRLRIGFVPQENVLHEALSVRQALGFAAELRFPGDVTEMQRAGRVSEVIRELGLEQRIDLAVWRLSGGERRRVSVALELLTKPSLLFLDEPTSGLDPGYERSLMELLRELADSGRTVVVVTHSVQSLSLCDRVLFLAPGGQPAYFGPPPLALTYFGCDDFQQVFQALSVPDHSDWSERFRGHPYHARYLDREPPEPPAQEQGETPDAPEPPAETPSQTDRERTGRGRSHAMSAFLGLSWLRQFRMVSRRYVRVLVADRANLALLVAQPIVLGLLMLAALPAHEFAAPAGGVVRTVSRAGLVLLVVMLGATWLGASNAVREIVKERPIFARERAVGLSISAYLGSKLAVLGLLTALQCAIMAAIALARSGSHAGGSLIGPPTIELVVVAVGAGVAAMTLGLLVSALALTADRAMTALPIIVILQMLLALGGVFPDVTDRPVFKQASYLSSTQWAFSAAASSVDLSRLQSLDKVVSVAPTVTITDPLASFNGLALRLKPEQRWEHDPRTWLSSMGALVGLMAVAIAATGLTLRRRSTELP